jgi:hypothetical protein
MATLMPASRIRSKRSGTAEKGQTIGKYFALNRSLRHFSSASPCACCCVAERKTGISSSPPLPIWLRACSNETPYPNLMNASCEALAWRSTESINVPSISKMTAFITCRLQVVRRNLAALSSGRVEYPDQCFPPVYRSNREMRRVFGIGDRISVGHTASLVQKTFARARFGPAILGRDRNAP